MLYCGIDPHKATHVISICDITGKQISTSSFNASIDGYASMLEWVKKQTNERVWGIENPQTYGIGLAQYLVSKGETVFAVPSILTGIYRKRSFARAKSDTHDALAVARATLREINKLTVVLPESPADELHILVEHHDNLKVEISQIKNRIHAHLNVLLPEYQKIGKLSSIHVLKYWIEQAQTDCGGSSGARWKVVVSLCKRLLEAAKEFNQLTKQMENVLKPLNVKPLLEIRGISTYLASKIISIVGNIYLFRNEAAFANFAGVAPVSCSSGKNEKYRVNPGGHRQLNCAIHQIMITQIRDVPLANQYYLKKQTEGKTKREAKRCLKRIIARIIFKALLQMKDFFHPPLQAYLDSRITTKVIA
jgi:transposase